MKRNCRWEHPYEPAPEYSRSVAYFSMEFGIDTALKTYSGGLGYLAGSHMRSAHDLKQNMIGIGMLWKFGYYDQLRDEKSRMKVVFRERNYSFLQETDLIFPVMVHGHEVKVQAFYLPPEVFGTVPMYFLSTDREHLNDYLSCHISYRLYDHNAAARVAQSMVLGIGGYKLVEALGGADIYHMNEAHAVPLAFQLYEKYGDVEKVRKRLVFTTHTPVSAGNEDRPVSLLKKMGFFGDLSVETVRRITQSEGDNFGYTPAALALSGRSNGVSQLHAKVANDMWSHLKEKPEIIGITNAQNRAFWQDEELKSALDNDDDRALRRRKRDLKGELFEIVADQTGKLFDPDVLTIVWARRFAGYKRADLIVRDHNRFFDLLNRSDQPVQIIWAGKPYPEDDGATDTFNRLIDITRSNHRAAVLTGYEMNLSAACKKGSDVWLNTPRRPKEASGTSGMTAAMNAGINFSINDGWIPEFARHGHNAFVIPEADSTKSERAQDEQDYEQMMNILNSEIIPCYYERPSDWMQIVKNSMRDVIPNFDSDRMAAEYYDRLFSR